MKKSSSRSLTMGVLLVLGILGAVQAFGVEKDEAKTPLLSFFPAVQKNSVSLFMAWDSPASLVRSLLGNGFPEDEKEALVAQVPPIDEGAMVVTVPEDESPNYFGAFRTSEGTDPSEVLETLASIISQETGSDVAVESFRGDLRDDLEPLSVIKTADEEEAVRSAVWKGDGRTVLLARSDQDLNSMPDVLSGSVQAFSPGSRRLKARMPLYMQVSIPNGVLRSEAEEFDIPILGSDDVAVELGVQKDQGEVRLFWYSNITDLLIGRSVGKIMEPLGADLPFTGGKVLGFAAARLARIDLDSVLNVISQDVITPEEFKLETDQIAEITGLTVDDMLDLLESRISVVLGGRTGTAIGEIPGLYLQIEPRNKDVLKKLTQVLPGFYDMISSFGFEEIELPGWISAYGMTDPIGAAVAVGESRALIGALDYSHINEPGSLSQGLKEAVDGGAGVLAVLSISDIREALHELTDEDTLDLIRPYLDMAAHLDLVKLDIRSLSEGELSVKLLE